MIYNLINSKSQIDNLIVDHCFDAGSCLDSFIEMNSGLFVHYSPYGRVITLLPYSNDT